MKDLEIENLADLIYTYIDWPVAWLGVFFNAKFLKNERRACDQQVWVLELPQAPLLDLTAKSGSTASLEFSGFQVESTESLGLRSNRAAELAVT